MTYRTRGRQPKLYRLPPSCSARGRLVCPYPFSTKSGP